MCWDEQVGREYGKKEDGSRALGDRRFAQGWRGLRGRGKKGETLKLERPNLEVQDLALRIAGGNSMPVSMQWDTTGPLHCSGDFTKPIELGPERGENV